MASQWTVSIDDSSPLIQYSPHGDGGVGDWTNTGWQPWYSDSGGFNSAGGNDALGTSYHVTAFSGARFEFQFYGTGVSLYGNTSCSYSVSVDGVSKSFSATEGTLFSQDGLAEQMHNVSVIAGASEGSTFWFDYADVSRPLATGAGAPTSVVYPATNATFLKYGGNWTVQNDPNGQIPSKEHPAPYYEASEKPASVSFSFTGTGVAVNGSRNWGDWTYDVDLDGNVNTYNASTMWLIGDALLFYQDGLDAQKTHTVNITPNVGGGFKFWLNSVTLLADSGNATANGTNSPTSATISSQSTLPTSGSPASDTAASSKKTDVGVIVGPIVGGIAALLILGALALWFRRRRRTAAAAAYTSAQFAPYVLPRASSSSSSPGMQEAGAMLVVSPTSKLAAEAASPYSGVRSPSTASSSHALSPPASAHPARSVVSSESAGQTQVASPTTGPPVSSEASQASSVAGGAAPQSPESQAAVDRLIQIIADRIDRTHPLRYEYGADVPPPEYGA